MTAFILPLRGVMSVASVGSKAARLSEVAGLGFAVPEGVVLTTAAYRHFCAQEPVRAELETLSSHLGADGPARKRLGTRIQALFRATPLQPSMLDSVRAGVAQLHCASLAVRSSAPQEDREKASFAGIFTSLLNVPCDGVADAIRACWSSVFSSRALHYLAHRGMDPHSLDMALLLQEMLVPTQSGVCFTANPITGCGEEIVIETVAGLAEDLVSGRVVPARILCRKSGTGACRQISGSTSVLTPSQLFELTSAARFLEAHFRAPQDIEFAFSGEILHILQTRPITAAKESRDEPTPRHE